MSPLVRMSVHVEPQETFPRGFLFPGELLVAGLLDRVVCQKDERSLVVLLQTGTSIPGRGSQD